MNIPVVIVVCCLQGLANFAVAAEGKPSLPGGLTVAEWQEKIKNIDPQSPPAEETVCQLIALLSASEVPEALRHSSAIILGRMGKHAKTAIPVIDKLLTTANDDRRYYLLRSLEQFGAFAKTAADNVVRIITDDSVRVSNRQIAMAVLSKIGIAEQRTIPLLTEVLNKKSYSQQRVAADDVTLLRISAAEALAYLGPQASSAVPTLLRQLDDEQENVRRQTIITLGAIGPVAEIAIPALVDLLMQEEAKGLREEAGYALAKIGSAAVPVLIQLLEQEDDAIRLQVVFSLGRIKPAAKSARKPLEKLLNDDNAHIQIAAANSLWKIDSENEQVQPIAVKHLQSRDRATRKLAATLLIAMLKASDNSQLVTQLQNLRHSKEEHIRQAVKKVLRTARSKADAQ